MPFMERLYSAMLLGTPMYDPAAGEIIEHKSEAFFNAIRSDDELTLMEMIEEGFDVDYHAFGHQPPLIFAIKMQRYRIIQTLLLYGADPNLSDREGNTPLHFAVKLNESEIILQLLQYGALKARENNEELSALDLAKNIHNKTILTLLKETHPLFSTSEEDGDLFALASKGNLHAIVATEPLAADLQRRDAQQRTLLHHAVFGNNIKLIGWLLSKGLNIDAADLHGITPLIIAASHPKFDKLLAYLLRRNPTIEQRTNNHSTALTLALRNGNPEAASLLMDYGANLLTHDGLHTPLTLVHRGIETYPELAGAYRKLMTRMLDRGAHTDIPTNKAGWTPLFHAAARMQDEAMTKHLRLLMQLGSNVDYADKNGRTPLMVAASMGRKSAVEALLNNYAHIDKLDTYGWSPLMLAIYYNHIEVTRFLCECGCDVNLTSSQGLSAMRIAQKHQRKQVVELLQEYGAIESETDEESE